MSSSASSKSFAIGKSCLLCPHFWRLDVMLMFLLTALVSIYTKCGNFKDAFDNFNFRQEAGVEPGNATSSVLKEEDKFLHRSKNPDLIQMYGCTMCSSSSTSNAAITRRLFERFHGGGYWHGCLMQGQSGIFFKSFINTCKEKVCYQTMSLMWTFQMPV